MNDLTSQLKDSFQFFSSLQDGEHVNEKEWPINLIALYKPVDKFTALAEYHSRIIITPNNPISYIK